MKTWLVGACALSIALAAGCKGETKYKDSPDTLAEIEKLQNDVKAKKQLITVLEGQVSKLKAEGGSGDEIMVTMEGEIVVKGGKSTGGKRPVGNVNVDAQAKAFYKHVSSAQKAVARCYRNALKKDSSLTGRPIKLRVKVSYGTDGKVSKVGMDKKISAGFAACLKNVASGWKVPPPPKKVTFSQTFALTPQ